MIAFLILGLAGSNRYNKFGYVNCDVDFRNVFVASNVRTTKPERGTFFITALQSSLHILGGDNQLSSDFWSVIIKACLKGNHQILITIIGERASLKLKRKHSSDCETNCDKSKEKNINLRSWMLIAKEWSFKSTCDVDSSMLPIKSLARSDKVRKVCGTTSWSMKGPVKQFASTVGRNLVSSGMLTMTKDWIFFQTYPRRSHTVKFFWGEGGR